MGGQLRVQQPLHPASRLPSLLAGAQACKASFSAQGASPVSVLIPARITTPASPPPPRGPLPGGLRLPSPHLGPPPPCTDSAGGEERGVGAERRGGLLAGVQLVELSPLAPSFASGQEAELRWKGRRQRHGQPLSPLVPGPLPHLLAPACASAPQLAELRPDPQAPQISDPPTPGFAPFPALPSPFPAMAGRFPSRCRARARPWPPRGNPGRSAQTPH